MRGSRTAPSDGPDPRDIYGARTALTIGLFSSFLGCPLGGLLGTASAYFSGLADLIIQRFVDVILSFPIIVLALVVVAVMGKASVGGIDVNLILAIAHSDGPARGPRRALGGALRPRDALYRCGVGGGGGGRRVPAGRQDLVARPELRRAAGRLAAREELEAAVAAWCAARPATEAASILQNAGVLAARVASPRDLVEEDPQLAARGYWQQVDHPEMGPALFTSPPFRIDGERVELGRPPLFGEHTEEVLGGLLGMGRDEIAAPAERKILA